MHEKIAAKFMDILQRLKRVGDSINETKEKLRVIEDDKKAAKSDPAE